METDIDKQAQNVVQLLNRYSYCLATAESCTGGMISAAITAIPGASEVFGLGICTYSNDAKRQMLGVKKETLESFGAVSEQTASEMATGIRGLANADFGVSVTGIAGPTGEVEGKPVGTVYIGIATRTSVKATRFGFDTNSGDIRGYVRRQTVSAALKLLADAVGEENS